MPAPDGCSGSSAVVAPPLNDSSDTAGSEGKVSSAGSDPDGKSDSQKMAVKDYYRRLLDQSYARAPPQPPAGHVWDCADDHKGGTELYDQCLERCRLPPDRYDWTMLEGFYHQPFEHEPDNKYTHWRDKDGFTVQKLCQPHLRRVHKSWEEHDQVLAEMDKALESKGWRILRLATIRHAHTPNNSNKTDDKLAPLYQYNLYQALTHPGASLSTKGREQCEETNALLRENAQKSLKLSSHWYSSVLDRTTQTVMEALLGLGSKIVPPIMLNGLRERCHGASWCNRRKDLNDLEDDWGGCIVTDETSGLDPLFQSVKSRAELAKEFQKRTFSNNPDDGLPSRTKQNLKGQGLLMSRKTTDELRDTLQTMGSRVLDGVDQLPLRILMRELDEEVVARGREALTQIIDTELTLGSTKGPGSPGEVVLMGGHGHSTAECESDWYNHKLTEDGYREVHDVLSGLNHPSVKALTNGLERKHQSELSRRVRKYDYAEFRGHVVLVKLKPGEESDDSLANQFVRKSEQLAEHLQQLTMQSRADSNTGQVTFPFTATDNDRRVPHRQGGP